MSMTIEQVVTTATFPPVHIPGEFAGEAEAPFDYRGPNFTVEQVLLEIRRINLLTAALGPLYVRVYRAHWKYSARDPHHPMYFEVYGDQFTYAISVYSNRLEIEVWRGHAPNFGHVSTMFPVTLDQLRQALATVARDWYAKPASY
jgi:hypothetical protein